MPKHAFAHVSIWIFDLDNTLYSSELRLFDQIDARMTAFIKRALEVDAATADRLRADYWRKHGTTLRGLMLEHKLDPAPFLADVHDIDLSHVAPAPALGAAIERLPGRKIVHTNGSRAHGERVLGRLKIRETFEAVFGIEDSDYAPKPARVAYERVAAKAAIDPSAAAFFEDTARNLEEPHAMGMRTVWTPARLGVDAARAAEGGRTPDGGAAAHVHFIADDLTAFLQRLG